jgi:cytochrome oxidase Cu insertion factor (SCO1/SenC/PrrC family)
MKRLQRRVRLAACAAGWLAIAGCAGKPAPPALAIPLPEFTLIDQDGRHLGLIDLRGRAWIANFIFTRCATVCPRLTGEMAKLQEVLRDDPAWPDLNLVSISVDPEHDDPQVLSDYASEHGADPGRWRFLTGSRDQIWQLCKEGFKLPVGEAPDDADMPIFHSAAFVLVDRIGRIRGYYQDLDGESGEALLRDLRAVLDETPPDERSSPPSGVIRPDWLETLAAEQIAAASSLRAFHGFRFTDRSVESGIAFRNRVTSDSTRDYKPVHYDHGNGITAADVDGDGREDLYLTSQLGPNALLKNLGGGRFRDISEEAGVTLRDAISVAASFADIDNDGDRDLYVTTVRHGNRMFANDGRGRFADITEHSGTGYSGHSSGALFFDYDRDGRLDLYLCNVGVYTGDDRGPDGAWVGLKDAFGGHLKNGERLERSILFRNLGDNRFADVSERVRLGDDGWSGDASPLDFNEDGWIDLFTLNMQGQDHYYENDRGERFVDRTRETFPRTPWGSMGIKVLDYDNDGDLDIFVTDMHSDMSEHIGPERERLKSRMQWPESFLQSDGMSIYGNALYRREKGDGVREVSDALGVETYWPWGVSAGDLNADGYEDLFIASGMNYPFRYGTNALLLNDLGERFVDAQFVLGIEPRLGGRTAKPWFEVDCGGADRDHTECRTNRLKGRTVIWASLASRSSVVFDPDADGDLDIVTNEFNDRPMVLLSDLSERRAIRYLKVSLVGTSSNRDGLGAKVRVRCGGRLYTRVHDGKLGHLSQGIAPLYFGLGEADSVDRIEVDWPSGRRQALDGPFAANSLVEVVEG